MRFALLEIKMAMIDMLKKYTFETCDKTPERLTYDVNSFLGVAKEDMFVKAIPRN